MGAGSEKEKRPGNALGCSGRIETTVLLERRRNLTLKWSRRTWQRPRLRKSALGVVLAMFAGGYRLDSGAAGYTIAWQNGQHHHWKGIKTHMAYNQETYNAECAARARALENRQMVPERVPIFTDAQDAIRPTASESLALVSSTQSWHRGTSHLFLRRARPDIVIKNPVAPST